jgi:hypothetical protein
MLSRKASAQTLLWYRFVAKETRDARVAIESTGDVSAITQPALRPALELRGNELFVCTRSVSTCFREPHCLLVLLVALPALSPFPLANSAAGKSESRLRHDAGIGWPFPEN